VGIVAKEDTGAGIVMMIMFVGMVFAAGLRGSLFLRLAGIFVVMIPVLYRFLDDYQKDRITAFLHPNNFSNTATYQVHQSKIAIGSGGIFGKGIGNGTIKESGFLPVAESDFIFSIICEELGFLGGVAVIALYSILLFRMWRVVRNAREVYGALLVVGFLCMLGFQMFEKIGMTMGIMPVTGITLPFLSSGGTSVMANMAIIGIVISVGVTTKIKSYKHVVTD
jgi:rod shape determining protein RodA